MDKVNIGEKDMLSIDKELFQWEKGRYVNVDKNHPEITTIEFSNKKSNYGSEVLVVDNKAAIPNYLLKEKYPILALACTEDSDGTKVVTRKVFKVFERPKPEYYVDDDDLDVEEDIPGIDIIYDGGVIK